MNTCPTCRRAPHPLWECSAVDCPRRRPGTSLWSASPFEATLPRKHDGLGWDRFYRGQRRPPQPGEKQ
jgi:hypothetical protein